MPSPATTSESPASPSSSPVHDGDDAVVAVLATPMPIIPSLLQQLSALQHQRQELLQTILVRLIPQLAAQSRGLADPDTCPPVEVFAEAAEWLTCVAQAQRALALTEAEERLDMEEHALFWFRGLRRSFEMESREMATQDALRKETELAQHTFQAEWDVKRRQREAECSATTETPSTKATALASATRQTLSEKYLLVVDGTSPSSHAADAAHPTTAATSATVESSSSSPLLHADLNNKPNSHDPHISLSSPQRPQPHHHPHHQGPRIRPDIPWLSVTTLAVAQLLHNERSDRNVLYHDAAVGYGPIAELYRPWLAEVQATLEAQRQAEREAQRRQVTRAIPRLTQTHPSLSASSVAHMMETTTTTTTTYDEGLRSSFSPEQQAAIKEAARRAVFPLLDVGRKAQSVELCESDTREAVTAHQDEAWEALLAEHSPLLAVTATSTSSTAIMSCPAAASAAADAGALCPEETTRKVDENDERVPNETSDDNNNNASTSSAAVVAARHPTKPLVASVGGGAAHRIVNRSSSSTGTVQFTVERSESTTRQQASSLFLSQLALFADCAKAAGELLLREQRARRQVVRDVLQDVRAVFEECDVAFASTTTTTATTTTAAAAEGTTTTTFSSSSNQRLVSVRGASAMGGAAMVPFPPHQPNSVDRVDRSSNTHHASSSFVRNRPSSCGIAADRPPSTSTANGTMTMMMAVAYTPVQWSAAESLRQLRVDSQRMIHQLFDYTGWLEPAEATSSSSASPTSSLTEEMKRQQRIAACGFLLREPSVAVRKATLSDRVEKFHRIRRELHHH